MGHNLLLFGETEHFLHNYENYVSDHDFVAKFKNIRDSGKDYLNKLHKIMSVILEREKIL